MDQADQFLTASTTMSARERLDVYVTDYWPRCLDSLADDFPHLRRFLGERDFSNWMIRYLESCPSRSYSLYYLPTQLPQFFDENYHHADRAFVLGLLRYEWAVAQAGFVAQKPAFSTQGLSESEKQSLASRRFTFQPHVFIEKFDYDFQLWIDKGTAKKTKKSQTHLLIFRVAAEVKITVISAVQWQLYTYLKQGSTLATAIELAIKSAPENDLIALETQLSTWMSEAMQFGIWVA